MSKPKISYKEINFKISNSNVHIRLDVLLSQIPEISSRSRAAKLIGRQLVQVNSKFQKASYIVQLDETITVQLPIESPAVIEPYRIALDILHEDTDVIVINKPAGLVMHPSAGHQQDSLVNALVAHSKDLSMGFGENRPGIVHRLDKDTSGVIVVAKNDHSHHCLAEQFRQKTAHRIYWALAIGYPKMNTFSVESYLRRHPIDRKRYASEKLDSGQTPQGKWSKTHFKVLSQSKGVSWMECKLETGRTHQIRIHLSENSFPIIGDSLYGGIKKSQNIKSVSLKKICKNINRLGLHATELGFKHPTTGQQMLFHSPWPNDLSNLLEEINFVSSYSV